MSDNEASEFDDWFKKNLDEKLAGNRKAFAKKAWNHQQKRIDELIEHSKIQAKIQWTECERLHDELRRFKAASIAENIHLEQQLAAKDERIDELKIKNSHMTCVECGNKAMSKTGVNLEKQLQAEREKNAVLMDALEQYKKGEDNGSDWAIGTAEEALAKVKEMG